MSRLLGRLRSYFTSSSTDEQAFAVWGERARERQDSARPLLAWSDSLIVQRRYIHPAISGSPDRNWLQWAADRFFKEPVDLALSIGSGDGGLERHGLAADVAKRFEAFDAAPGAVELARELAREHHVEDRVHYQVADLNEHAFESRRYDAAFASMAVHHIRELEHFFSQIKQALKPGALFVVNEFVGPNQFQWTDRQIELADELLRRIPESHRRSLASGHIKSRNVLQPISSMNTVDPTEAIRSADILPLMRTHFDLIEKVDYGGTILNLALEEIAGNFDDTPEDLAILRPLFDAERDYIQRGVIPSDFTVLVARNRLA